MSTSEERMTELTPAQFSDWRALIEEHSGIQVAPERQSFIQSGVRRRLAELGGISADSYFDRVSGLDGAQERRVILDRLLIKETHFFRHRDSYHFLTQFAVRQLSEGASSLNCWSAGCATGEEAYSMAMAIQSAYAACQKKPLYGVVGTDISHEALASAREATYKPRQLRHVSERQRRQYFEQLDSGDYIVHEPIRKRVCFFNSNILKIPRHSFASGLDVIFCQNLLIYFRRWRRREIIQALAQCLKPGGLLVLGVGESSEAPSQLLSRVPQQGVLAYVRTGQ